MFCADASATLVISTAVLRSNLFRIEWSSVCFRCSAEWLQLQLQLREAHRLLGKQRRADYRSVCCVIVPRSETHVHRLFILFVCCIANDLTLRSQRVEMRGRAV
jgi:hypothetical protein